MGDGKPINEAIFCQEFLANHRLIYTENTFFTVNVRMVDEIPLKSAIYHELASYASTNVTKKFTNIIELMKITAHIPNFIQQADRIHVANGTLYCSGLFAWAFKSLGGYMYHGSFHVGQVLHRQRRVIQRKADR